VFGPRAASWRISIAKCFGFALCGALTWCFHVEQERSQRLAFRYLRRLHHARAMEREAKAAAAKVFIEQMSDARSKTPRPAQRLLAISLGPGA